MTRRTDPPVDYGPVRPWLQRVRAVLVTVLLAACLVGLFAGLEDIWIPISACVLVLADALYRSRVESGIGMALAIDAVAIGLALGWSPVTEPVLVAAAAYLIAASVAFAGVRWLGLSTAVLVAALAVRELVPVPETAVATQVGSGILWVATGVFLAAVVLSMLATATAVHAARDHQETTIEDVQRAAEMKSEFVSMISHELRTPLTNISGFADTLRHGWQSLPASEVNEFLDIIVGEASHLGNLVDDVLAIPRLEAGRLLLDITEFPLRPAAYKVADLLFPAGGPRSASVAIGGNVSIVADPNRVEQVLRNLLENARKYGGEQVEVSAQRVADDWVVCVADNGPGVAEEHRDRIFGAFEQGTSGDSRAESGFGLGLSVARHLVEAMGGRIWYEDGFPVGARFCFSLPSAVTRVTATEAVA